MQNDKESDTREKEQIEAMIWTYTRDVKNEATGALDKLRTQVKMHQLRTSREKKLQMLRWQIERISKK